MTRFLILLLTIMFCMDKHLCEKCWRSDLCGFDTMGDKIRYYISPLTKKCDLDNFEHLINFLYCTDDQFTNCGYISETQPEEGVKIALGFDLSKVTNETLIAAQIPEDIQEQLAPYLGLKGKEAAKALEKRELNITFHDAGNFSSLMWNYYYQKLETEYDEDCKDCPVKFASLSLKKRATLLSLYQDLHGIKENNEELWTAIVKNYWEQVADIIQKMRYPALKRKAEYLNLKSDLHKCDKRTDTLIIYGNEGHISTEKFEMIRKYFLDYIDMVNLMDNRMNFATPDRTTLITLLDHFSGLKGDLYNRVQNEISFPYFINEYDLSVGIQQGIELFSKDADIKKTIVLVSDRGEGGVALDDWMKIKEKADLARFKGIKVIAFMQDYLFSYSKRMLEIVGGDYWNSINNYNYEEEFLCSNTTLYSKICTYFDDEVHVDKVNTTLNGYVRNFDSPKFYKFNVENKDMHQKVLLIPTNDLLREVNVNVFLSYSNPFPDRDFNDMGHFGNNTKNTSLTIGVNKSDSENSTTLYVGVYSEYLGYNITFSECHPSNSSCIIGTNDDEEKSLWFHGWVIAIIVTIVSCALVGITFIIYQYLRGRKGTNYEFTKLQE